MPQADSRFPVLGNLVFKGSRAFFNSQLKLGTNLFKLIVISANLTAAKKQTQGSKRNSNNKNATREIGHILPISRAIASAYKPENIRGSEAAIQERGKSNKFFHHIHWRCLNTAIFISMRYSSDHIIAMKILLLGILNRGVIIHEQLLSARTRKNHSFML